MSPFDTATILASPSMLNFSSSCDSNPEAAATLLDAINAAKTVKDNGDATQEQVEAAIAALSTAINTAKVEVSRITLTIPAKSYMARIDADTLAAGKCWIELIPTLAAHARRLSIVHEGETTGISTVKTTVDTKDAAVYDLQGRRVMQPTKGLFIVNGKKVVIK